jgi:hypothetical protein
MTEIIEPAFADPKDLTHLPNGIFFLVIFHEPEDFLSLTEKMLTAFFKMSRSIFTSASSFRNLTSSFCSSVSCLLPFLLKARERALLNSLRQR